jgi:hypothetical protein
MHSLRVNRVWKRGLKALTLAVLVVACFCPPNAEAERTREVFFQGTDHELHVYRIKGREPGKTLLLIGGIQGNEPGGFLSADLYADMELAKGNLIVVPRANFYSIVLNRRQVNEDMNRKFAHTTRDNYETKIVSILKQLISESDCLLNLHDGSGFYRPRWESPMKNPMRYGQSIIADCASYTVPETGKVLELKEMAEEVIKEVNAHIANPEYKFRFNNHRTSHQDTLHAEQRKSATYFAVFECGIPAFGIETSKSLPLELKIRQHNHAINAFMNLLDIVPQTPGIYLDPPVMHHLVMAVNDNLPFAVANGKTLHIQKGDSVTVSHVQANYERGLSADVIGYGTFNDIGKPISVTESTQVIVRKDHHSCGVVNIVLDAGGKTAPVAHASPEVLFFKVKVNGGERLLVDNATARLIRGDRFEIVDVVTSPARVSGLTVNFKGFVGNRRNNTGEDRGYVIHTDQDLWERYAIDDQGDKYRVVVMHDEMIVGRLYVELAEPEFDYIVAQVNKGIKRCLYPGDSMEIFPNDTIRILDIKTNVPANAGVQAFLEGMNKKIRLFSQGAVYPQRVYWKIGDGNGPCRVVVQRDRMVFGSILLDLSKEKRHEG